MPTVDVTAKGYAVAEYHLDGDATSYRLVAGTKRTTDGKWQVRERGTAPFRSRILVVRPARAEDFNGTVVLHWQNVTAGYELGAVGDDEYLRGYAWVGVSAQKVGIDGFPGPDAAGLKQWDPDRYGSLEHPGDDYSYDIFTEAARAVGPQRANRGAPNDPMAGLDVERLIAAGASQSASRLRAYINGVHPLVRVIDGFMPYISSGGASTLKSNFNTEGGRRRSRGGPVMIREDLDVPVFMVNSETEALRYLPVRQTEGDRFRLWEVAGSSHVAVPRLLPGDIPSDRQQRTDIRSPNWLSYFPAYFAALRHMHVWLRDGTEPPILDKIRITRGAEPGIARDRYGNALGGIRLPNFRVPTASHSGFGARGPGLYRLSFLFGAASDFTVEQLRSLYGSVDAYTRAYDLAVQQAVDAGVLLEDDVPAMRGRAIQWVDGRLNSP